MLRWEGQFVGSHDCILLNQPSNFAYQALEESNILEIDYSEVEKIMAENLRYEPVRNHVLMTMLSGALKMIEDFSKSIYHYSVRKNTKKNEVKKQKIQY